MAARSDVGGVLVLHAPLGSQDEATINSLIGKHPEQRAPVLVCVMGETTGALHRNTLARAGLPVFATPDQAVRGFEHLVQDRRNRAAARELPARTVLTVAPDVAWVRSIFSKARAAGRLGLTQDESLDVLAAYGVPAVPTRCVAGPEDAVPAAELLGYPAAVKLREASAPAHREPGGLALDLRSAGRVAAAARRLAEGDTELVVQYQVGRGRELAVRVADDAIFGPAISFGSSGTDPHPSDQAADLPPLNLALAHGLIRRSRTGALLGRPMRDRPVADTDAVAEALVRISQLIVDFPEIAVLDLPSLFADAGGVMAVDAWLRLRAADEPPARLAIAPYPAELVTHVEVGGDAVTIRPIRPEDAEAHIAFLSRLSPQDLRYRFFSAIRELSREQIARLTQVDYDREMAFVATRDVQGDTLGVARLISELDGRSGEFAVVVQPDMKGRGLGTLLMRRVIEWGRQKGWVEVVGQILRSVPSARTDTPPLCVASMPCSSGATIWAESDRSKNKIVGHDLLAQGLQSAAPAKVIGQVLRRDAMERTQPFLEAAVIGVDVVDVEIGCLRVGLAGHWQDVGWDASPAGEGNDRGATVATEFVGCRDDTAKRRCNRHAVQFCQHRIRGRTMTVSCHENRDLFGGNSALGRFAASLARLTRHAGSLAFERFQNEGFVAFDDPRQRFRLVASQRNEEPMSPAKCRGVVHVASFRGLSDADTVDHGLGLCRPFVLHSQTGQWRVRQGVERTLTAFATVARQSARLAPMHDIAAVAMRATDAVNSALPKFSNDIGSKPVQRLHHRR